MDRPIKMAPIAAAVMEDLISFSAKTMLIKPRRRKKSQRAVGKRKV